MSVGNCSQADVLSTRTYILSQRMNRYWSADLESEVMTEWQPPPLGLPHYLQFPDHEWLLKSKRGTIRAENKSALLVVFVMIQKDLAANSHTSNKYTQCYCYSLIQPQIQYRKQDDNSETDNKWQVDGGYVPRFFFIGELISQRSRRKPHPISLLKAHLGLCRCFWWSSVPTELHWDSLDRLPAYSALTIFIFSGLIFLASWYFAFLQI